MPKTPQQRKDESITLLKTRGVPLIEHLPVIEGEDEAALQTPEEALRRMRALWVYHLRGAAQREGIPLDVYRQRLDGLGAWGDLSASERAVVEAKKLSEQQMVQASWAPEAAVALQWAVGLVRDLPWPGGMCNPDAAAKIVYETPSAAGLRARAVGDVLDQGDLHYRLLWACRQAMIDRSPPPKGVHPSVVIERRRALDWMVRQGLDWDEADVSS